MAIKEKNKKVNKTKNEKSKVKKENYFKGVIKEMKLVKWPTPKEALKYTIATLALCVIICGFFLLINLLLNIIKGWFV